MHFVIAGLLCKLYAFVKENLGRNRINEDIAHPYVLRPQTLQSFVLFTKPLMEDLKVNSLMVKYRQLRM